MKGTGLHPVYLPGCTSVPISRATCRSMRFPETCRDQRRLLTGWWSLPIHCPFNACINSAFISWSINNTHSSTVPEYISRYNNISNVILAIFSTNNSTLFLSICFLLYILNDTLMVLVTWILFSVLRRNIHPRKYPVVYILFLVLNMRV